MWFLKILRMMFVTLDNAVYQCVDWLYQLFMMLAETGIFSSTDIRNFANRMYFFLGLIMIFKVSISIIQYIMNPDSAKDNKIGAPALLKNIVIILIGIVMIPYVFEAAYSLQRIVLKDNVIGSLILGMNYSNGDDSEDMVKNAGNRMAFSTYTAFFHFDTAYIDEECANNPLELDEKGDYTGELSEACKSGDGSEAVQSFFDSKGANSFKKAYETLNMHKLYNDKIYNYTITDEDGDKQFLFSYMILITTLAGGFLAYILLLFCFDIAVRSVKLGFLQLIAPIPLIAKIDPKKGQETFNKWVKECTSTYLQLFLRLASIYFAIFIISVIGKGMFNVVEPDKEWNNPFVFVFIIFGTLLFVKDLPKLIETITGIKMGDGKGSLNLAKKLGGVPLAGNMMGNTARKVMGGIDAKRNGKSFKAGWNKAKQNDKGLFADIKKWDAGMRPYSADKRKKRVEGLEEYGTIHSKWEKGQSVRNELGKEKLNFSNFDGKNRKPYEMAYKHKDFINSLMNMDAQDSVDKKIRALYSEAQTMGSDWKGGTITMADGSTKSYTSADLKALSTDVDTSAKTLKGLTEVHETMRKTYSDDAAMQDAIKFNKYNEQDPTNPKRDSNDSPNESSTITSSEKPTSHEVQDRINEVNGVHEAPTRDQHNEQQDYYTRLFNSDEGSRYVDANEREADRRNNN